MISVSTPSDLEDLFEETMPAATPSHIAQLLPGLADRLAKLDRFATLSAIAGLQMDADFHANAVRLDVAQRLVLMFAVGSAKPTRDKLFRLLNRDLVDANVHVMEDPNEDVFISRAATWRGNLLFHRGVWEKAGPFTEDMLEAFATAPDSIEPNPVVEPAFALMRVADLLVRRAGHDDVVTGGGTPVAKIALPDDRKIVRLASLPFITWEEIDQAGINRAALTPFLLETDLEPAFGDHAPGSSAIERRPLIELEGGILVVAPHNLSIAARAHLVISAGDRASEYARRLLQIQSIRVTESSFAHLWGSTVRQKNGLWMSEAIWETSTGRFVHIVHITDGFEDADAVDFGSPVPDSQDVGAIVAKVIDAAQTEIRGRPGFRSGLSVLLLGGWGRSRALQIPQQAKSEDWDFLALEPHDAATIALCDNGRLEDLWRLSQQIDMVHRQGFQLVGANGWINLFGLWRETKLNIVPEHLTDFQPPIFLNYPTDYLLAVRLEALTRQDRRAVRRPDGQFEIVSRVDPRDFFDVSDPVYCSTAGILRSEMLGVVCRIGCPVWIRVTPDRDHPHSFEIYETWRAAMHWLNLTLPALGAAYPDLRSRPLLIDLDVEFPHDLAGEPANDAAIDAAVVITEHPWLRSRTLRIGQDWHLGLRRANNYAEVSLAAAMLAIVAELNGASISRDDLKALVIKTVGSDAFRWRHSFIADRPLTMLKTHGLTGEFRAIPPSASALVKCGSVFLSQPNAVNEAISGFEECAAFLMEHHAALLTRLLDIVATFDRVDLVRSAIARQQAAHTEERIWNFSARALQAIYGAEQDRLRSLDRRNEVNAAIRACSILAEVGASHGAVADGLPVGAMDMDELMALALLMVQTAELIPPIRGGFAKPDLRVSPTGDILYAHEFSERALHGPVRVRHAQERVSAGSSYEAMFAAKAQEEIDRADIDRVIAAEYGGSAAAFYNLSSVLTELAVKAGDGVLLLRRTALLAAVVADGTSAEHAAGLVDRLTLPSREGWTAFPGGATLRDFDLSKFDRRFSPIGRPLIALDASNDPLIAVGPHIVERSAVHNVDAILTGGLQGDFWSSAAVRSYVGSAAESLGMDFNNEVAATVGALGLQTFASVKLSDCLHHKGTEAVKRLGDVDVLAFSPDRRHVWVIEAKEIRFCRTLAETASRLSEYRGLSNQKGRRDNLLKHLDRVDYVRLHAADLAKRYKLPAIPKIHGLAIVDSPQPMAFFPTHPSPDARFIDLATINTIEWMA